jgi:NhaA family Na+:H+ antiporter
LTEKDEDDIWPGYKQGATFIESRRPVARLAKQTREFMDVEAAGGVVLLIATIASLICANTPIGDNIANFWAEEVSIVEVGNFQLHESLGEWINDGLMALFFFVVGLEIKIELVTGELRDPRRAALPAIAAIGGMVVPAGIYLLLNSGGAGADGWGIPMATDIAFAVGVLALLGSRIPSPLKVFLLTLAIVDDIGAIMVIAIFYTEDISWGWLLASVAGMGVVVGLRLMRVWYIPIYVVIGIFIWMAMLESGIHATIAGVVLGLLTPAMPLRPRPTEVSLDPTSSWDTIRSTLFDAKESVSVAERLEHAIHPWTAFVVLPLFAFANAGIEISRDSLSEAASSPVTIGIVLGLVIGKPVGIVLAAWIADVTGIGNRPAGVTWRHITGAGLLAGIGFTVSLFVTGLAFTDPIIVDDAKIGVLVASVVAATLGAITLSRKTAENKVDADTVEATAPD